MSQQSIQSWYVLRFPSQDLSKVQNHLNQSGVKCFVPVTFNVVDGLTNRVPVLPGYIFVEGPIEKLDLAKSEYEEGKLKFVMDTKLGKPKAFDGGLVADFIQVASQTHQGIEFLDSRREVNVKHGPMVKVVADGPFKGVVGEYLRVRSNRCVVVRLGGLVTVATGFLKPDQVEHV